MTHNETAQILAILNAAYPAFYSKIKPREFEGIIDIWAEMFETDDFNIVKYALKQLIAQHTGFPPDIAALKAKINEVIAVATGQPTHEELWQILKKAVANGIYGADEEFAKLPEVLQKYCGTANTIRTLAQIDEQTFNTVNHGQFLKQIPIIEQRQEFELSMPNDIKKLISQAVKSRLSNKELNDSRNAILKQMEG